MSRICDICGKGRQVGNNVSHSKRRTKRTWQPNLRKTKLASGREALICSRCLKTLTKSAKG
ncbi:50S ribosomal protein L28 [candidate division Kazan bacterium RIFCSPHIGHO2_01_FULL_49_10]|uniref:Large ribosomal subunit protein bL28 n=1 Tax=candidate division Kazan bacterium RIFCSPLOWO2_01_FULL_48_13 TaxID=1798539 RepID=A0A1F4PNR6_UNCK3|nr:MAG: 50S ribosomal protein L28 [candidate division Kazan bacterium RIFCSPHIGHO2_01_FULL_49_10]OGB85236.1 MAG: 50S ribosomal protein L28 [candidate division Kazan bacterium RIFCSPLOWO2_01_FULL_48_13]